jgi:hypothetical protein
VGRAVIQAPLFNTSNTEQVVDDIRGPLERDAALDPIK